MLYTKRGRQTERCITGVKMTPCNHGATTHTDLQQDNTQGAFQSKEQY